jgi:Flp pilus assembly pilin Flp
VIWYAHLLGQVLVDRIRTVRNPGDDRDRGASALEWAIIAGVSVVLAVLIGGIVYHIVQKNSTALSNCGDTPIGDNTTCAPAVGGN